MFTVAGRLWQWRRARHPGGRTGIQESWPAHRAAAGSVKCHRERLDRNREKVRIRIETPIQHNAASEAGELETENREHRNALSGLVQNVEL
jgi:hypothetical protein